MNKEEVQLSPLELITKTKVEENGINKHEQCMLFSALTILSFCICVK